MVRHSLPLPDTIVRSLKNGNPEESCAPWLLGKSIYSLPYLATVVDDDPSFLGMHKKSLEAAATLQSGDMLGSPSGADDSRCDDDDDDDDDLEEIRKERTSMVNSSNGNRKTCDESRANSIASLRAKAQEHADKLHQGLVTKEDAHSHHHQNHRIVSANNAAFDFRSMVM